MQRFTRRSYLISLSAHDQKQRTEMRNTLAKLNASEILPGVFVAALTPDERAKLTQKYANLRVKQH